MPIFHDPDRQRSYDLWCAEGGRDDKNMRHSSSISRNLHRTNNWELEDVEMGGTSSEEDPSTSLSLFRLHANDRAEFIQHIKRREMSTWMRESTEPVRHHSRSPHASVHDSNQKTLSKQEQDSEAGSVHGKEVLGSPADIERPRSALHTGDFREGISQQQSREQPHATESPHGDSSSFHHFGSSPTTPWYSAPFSPAPLRRQTSSRHQPDQIVTTKSRSRAPSLGSFSSSYVLKAPTSPLVHQANNTDLDFSPRTDTDLANVTDSVDKANRRRTLPPETFRQLHSYPSAPPGLMSFRTPHATGKHEDPFPYQSYQPRRSLTSAYSLQLASSVQSPASRARRPSLSSDVSSKHHAPMVGSYEESILRGRMSMNPSKPLDFTAQIGVLGKGKCKANLKCPPHVTIPFPAVFYSYPTSGSGRSISDDNPSPYVGMIDLENSLPKGESGTNKRRRQHHNSADAFNDIIGDNTLPKLNHMGHEARRLGEKRNRRTESPKCPPGGCYRIPQQGQLQIMIKNPNKTAVKLFLVPYDLSDMEPGTKTFIRQRSYSAGPIIDMPLTARKNLGTDRPEASLNPTEDPRDKPILRYLIHLNICCPSNGRFYLHSSIRVVFANRVPDGKEKLRNEIQHPDPRYSPYRPMKDTMSSSTSAKLAAENAQRRRGAGQGMTAGLAAPSYETPRSSRYPLDVQSNARTRPTAAPLRLSSASAEEDGFLPESLVSDRYGRNDCEWALVPAGRASSRDALPWPDPHLIASSNRDTPDTYSAETGMYNKLSKGDAGYGGYPFGSFSSSSEAGESLLAKRLRGLDVQKPDTPDSRRTGTDQQPTE